MCIYKNTISVALGLQRPRIASPEGTGDVRRSCRKSPHLLVVGARNSRDPGPVWLRQEAKRGNGGGGGAIGVEIAPPPHRMCLRTPPGLTGNRNSDKLEGGGGEEKTAVTIARRCCEIGRGWRLRNAYLQCSVREPRPSRRDRCRPGLTGRLQTEDFKRPDEEQGGMLPRKRRTNVPWPR